MGGSVVQMVEVWMVDKHMFREGVVVVGAVWGTVISTPTYPCMHACVFSHAPPLCHADRATTLTSAWASQARRSSPPTPSTSRTPFSATPDKPSCLPLAPTPPLPPTTTGTNRIWVSGWVVDEWWISGCWAIDE